MAEETRRGTSTPRRPRCLWRPPSSRPGTSPDAGRLWRRRQSRPAIERSLKDRKGHKGRPALIRGPRPGPKAPCWPPAAAHRGTAGPFPHPPRKGRNRQTRPHSRLPAHDRAATKPSPGAVPDGPYGPSPQAGPKWALPRPACLRLNIAPGVRLEPGRMLRRIFDQGLRNPAEPIGRKAVSYDQHLLSTPHGAVPPR